MLVDAYPYEYVRIYAPNVACNVRQLNIGRMQSHVYFHPIFIL